MAFKKGQSGNPSGRPKQNPELRELARARTRQAIETLASIMTSKKAPAAARVAAAVAILDRGFGKPTQMAEYTHSVDDSLSRLLRQIDGQTKGL